MTSVERHLNRYKRRVEYRKQKRLEFAKQFEDIDDIISLNALYKAAKECTKGVMWKQSTQKFWYNRFRNITRLRQEILNGVDIRKNFIEFDIFERGKSRHIKAIHIYERCMQKSLTQNVLIPLNRKYLIYDNGACIKGKGCSFALKRCQEQLMDYYKHYGNKGYVLEFDFKHYFDSIPTDKLINYLNRNVINPQVKQLVYDYLSAFGKIGIGLGSEICQIGAVSYCNPIDHTITSQLGLKYYERYMDDGHIIYPDKSVLKEVLKLIIDMANELGLKLNKNKTHIVKLSKGFTFLKTRFILKSNGKIIKLVWKKSVTRERRKLHKLYKVYKQGLVTLDKIRQSVTSWIGSIKRKMSYHIRRNMIRLYYKLFKERISVYGKLKPINS